MSWLLDSDVLSQPAKKAGNVRVITWLEEHKDECYTSSIVIAQLAFWVRSKRGRQRVALQKWLTNLIDALHGRILGLNVSVAHVWAEQQHQLQIAGKPMPVAHGGIARHRRLCTSAGADFQSMDRIVVASAGGIRI